MAFWRFLLLAAASLMVFPLAAADATGKILNVLAIQADAWNTGDLQTFMTTYADDCTFMGKEVLHSREQVLARYRRVYPSTTAMGRLTFSRLDVREIGQNIAIVTGSWHLDRNSAAGGNVGGYFSLVLKEINNSWKIILDHTTAAE